MIFINKFKNNKKEKNKGFVLLFAVILSSIVLSISLGLSNISLNQLVFSHQSKNTSEAFLAADAGIECALFYDNKGSLDAGFASPFGYDPLSSGPYPPLQCSRQNFGLLNYTQTGPWNFILSNLGETGEGCAVVRVEKTVLPTTIDTKVISKGYNKGGVNTGACSSTDRGLVEREIEINYSSSL